MQEDHQRLTCEKVATSSTVTASSGVLLLLIVVADSAGIVSFHVVDEDGKSASDGCVCWEDDTISNR